MNRQTKQAIDELEKPQRLVVMAVISTYVAARANGLEVKSLAGQAIEMKVDQGIPVTRGAMWALKLLDESTPDLLDVVRYIATLSLKR